MAQVDLDIQLAKVREVKERHEGTILLLPNVVGVGIGFKEKDGRTTSELSVKVYVEQKIAAASLRSEEMVPPAVGDTKTDVVEVGRIVAQTYDARVRPARPGYSIGHYKITAGTFGCLVRDVCPPCRTYILSNNHVLANSNAAAIGDPIVQPGVYDGGTVPGDVVARLSRFVPLYFGSPDEYNLVDAALALPLDQRLVIASTVALGIPRGTVEATLGMPVVKSGRTTQTSAGTVTGIDVTVAVGYGSGLVAYFRNQIFTTNMSAGGDSGSLLLSRADRLATGLLFAGSSVVTVHNQIRNVLMALGVEMVTP